VTASEKLIIETPEQIALEFTLAGVGSRFLALAVDTIIQVTAGGLAALIGFGMALWSPFSMPDFGMWMTAIVTLFVFLLTYGYFSIFEIWWQGQTPGKRLLGLRVMDASGRPAAPARVLLRNLLRIIDMIPGLYAVGILSMLLTSRQQRLGDLAAGTVVVLEKSFTGEHVVQPAPAGERLQVSRLTAEEIAVVERFLQRRTDLDWEVRERAARDIATRVRDRLGLPPGGSDEDLLERVRVEFRTSGQYR